MQLWSESTRYFFDNPVNPDFGLRTPGSGRWSGSSPKFKHLVPWSLLLQEISSKSVHNFFIYPTDRQQTDRQTNRTENITSFFGGGNNLCTRWMNIYEQLARANQYRIICLKSVTYWDNSARWVHGSKLGCRFSPFAGSAVFASQGEGLIKLIVLIIVRRTCRHKSESWLLLNKKRKPCCRREIAPYCCKFRYAVFRNYRLHISSKCCIYVHNWVL